MSWHRTLHELLAQPIDESFNTASETNVHLSENLVEVKNLSFAYPNEKYIGIIKNLNLNIKKGEKIGIVGASGCGKTTFLRILLRLAHGYSGEVTFLGRNLKNVSRPELAKNVAYVPQKTYIFSGTIKENITYGCARKISQQEIVAASKTANIYSEITHSLGGFEGKITENGANISGGQRQRLAIARLILSSPELIILDEATSALDNTNEAQIQKNLDSIFKDKTIITVAHRLTTLKNSNRILVFDKGTIVEEGTFTELSQKEGLFKDFLNQMLK